MVGGKDERNGQFRKGVRRGKPCVQVFFLFDLLLLVLRAGLLKLMTVFILTLVQGFVLCKACSHTFLFDSCNTTMSLISCHSPPWCNHVSLVAVLGPCQTPPCLGAFAHVIPLSWNVLSTPDLPTLIA